MTKILIIEPVNGLCNRLRAMASGWILAKHLDREFKVVWKDSKDIGYCKFEQLFEPVDFITHSVPDSATVFVAGIKTEMSLLDQLCKCESECIYLQKTGGNYIAHGMDLKQFNNLKSEFYNSLVPVKDVASCVDRFLEKNNLEQYLGVHIRRTDRRSFTPETEMFARAIDRFKAKHVLLCTDDEKEREKLSKLTSAKITMYPKKVFDRYTPASVKEALVEWLLLGRCSNIVFSHGSSYGYEACVYGKLQNALELRSKREKSDNEKRNLPDLKFGV
jgi:hypothetical protein